MKNSKKIMLATALLAAGYTAVVLAHNLTDNSVGLSGSGLAKTDIYNVNCNDAGDGSGVPTKLFIQVKDNAPVKTPTVTIQASKSGCATPISSPSTDATDGDTVFSPGVTLACGAGDYTVTVTKSAYTGTVAANKGAELYLGVAHCQNSSGGHTGTDISLISNN